MSDAEIIPPKKQRGRPRRTGIQPEKGGQGSSQKAFDFRQACQGEEKDVFQALRKMYRMDRSHMLRHRAMETILAYSRGKPAQIVAGDTDGGPIVFRVEGMPDITLQPMRDTLTLDGFDILGIPHKDGE